MTDDTELLTGLDYLRMRAETSVTYFLQAGADGPVKIGVTTRLSVRIKGLQTAHYEELRLVAYFPGLFEHERQIHKRLAHLHIRGEWYRPEPELFALITELRATCAPFTSNELEWMLADDHPPMNAAGAELAALITCEEQQPTLEIPR